MSDVFFGFMNVETDNAQCVDMTDYASLLKRCLFFPHIGSDEGIFVYSDDDDSDIYGTEIVFFFSYKDICYLVNTRELSTKIINLAVFKKSTLKRYLITNINKIKISD